MEWTDEEQQGLGSLQYNATVKGDVWISDLSKADVALEMIEAGTTEQQLRPTRNKIDPTLRPIQERAQDKPALEPIPSDMERLKHRPDQDTMFPEATTEVHHLSEPTAPATMFTYEESEHDDDDKFVEDYTSKYELRPQSGKAGFETTWLDQDQTGDYDPSEERRRLRPRRRKVKARERAPADAVSDNTEDDEVSSDTSTGECLRLLVKLKFPSEKSKASFRKHVQTLRARTEPSTDAIATGYKLRKKSLATTACNSNHVHSDQLHDKPGLLDDLTGHPAARGCKGCFELGIRCQLLDDEHAWPCITCDKDNHDCELITPPIRKRACERCKNKRKTCSYTDTHDHERPCEHCAKVGYHCVAGPHRDSIRTRIRYDRDWKNDPLPPQKVEIPKKAAWTCYQCREAGRLCSFNKGRNRENCTACESVTDVCWAEPVVVVTPQRRNTTHRIAEAPVKKRATRGTAEQPTPTKQRKTVKDSAGVTKTITTKFCHPIMFNHEDVDGTTPCSFCGPNSCAILGLEPKVVEVIDWTDGRGLEEMGGGHMARGGDNTRVCTECTMQRIPIIMCPKHVMCPIPGLSQDLMDVDGALEALLSNTQREGDRWCTICPSLATYECEVRDEMSAAADSCVGCGLSLCEICMADLTGHHDGDLQTMLGGLQDDPSEERPFGLRADAEFLKEDGLLMRYVSWSTLQ